MSTALEQIRAALEKGANTILLHSNADMDCAGTAAALALHYRNAALKAPAGVSHLGKRLLFRANVTADDDADLPENGNIIVVDAQDDPSLGYPGTPWGRAIVIDHHKPKGNSKAMICHIDEGAASCCEIIWDIIGRPDEIDAAVGLCLMAGIIADTGHLRRGGHATLRAASEILEASGLGMEDVLRAFESAEDQDVSRRMSRLKGVQRMKFERVGDWVVAVSEIGAFESAVCQALVSTGADVAFAGSQNEEAFRITGRANSLATEAGLHLGEMLNRIAGEIGGEGGGHDGAAGLSGTGDAEAMLNICSQSALAVLKGKRRAGRKEENLL